VNKRDYIAEIILKRSRLFKGGSRWQQFNTRAFRHIKFGEFLEEPRQKTMPSRYELVKYLPIGFVACIEGYFRLVFRYLIDYGSPFRENAGGFKDVRLGIEQVVAIQGGKFTLGEFISHLLPINGLDDINRSMSILLGDQFLDRVKQVKLDIFVGQPPKSLEEAGNHKNVFQAVQRLFEHRHIFVHELTTHIRVNVRDIRAHTEWSFYLMFATELLIQELLKSNE
jgi:hypothetical protein